jgi:hypothetical protein
MEYKKSVPQNFNTMANEFTVLVKSAIIKSITGMLVGDVLSKPYQSLNYGNNSVPVASISCKCKNQYNS